MLEFSNWEFTANIVHMLRALMNTVDDMQEQTGNISREMETLRTNQKEMLEIKKKKQQNTVTDMIHPLIGLSAGYTELRKESPS